MARPIVLSSTRKRHRWLPLIAILTLLIARVLLKPMPGAELQVPQQTPATGTIRGIVTRTGTSEPIADVFISAIDRGGGARGVVVQTFATARGQSGTAAAPLSTKSDRSGHFVFESIPAGSYEIRAELEGYFGPESNGTFPTYVSTLVTLDGGKPAPDMTFSLIPGATIAGRVAEADGRPAVAAAVQALRVTYQNGLPVLQAAGTNSTDDHGDYRLFRLPPGEYYVAAIPAQGARGRGFAGARGTVSVPAGSVKIFYPGTVDISTARPVVIAGGDELPGMNVDLRDTHTIKISGQVVNTIPFSPRVGPRGNVQTTSVQLILTPHEKNVLADPNSTNAASVALEPPANGQFEIAGILPGSYDLFARVQNLNAVADPAVLTTQPSYYFGRTSFESRFDDVQGLSLVIRPGLDLRVHVTVDGNPSAASGIVRATLQSDDGARLIPAYARGGRQQPIADADGTIEFSSINEGVYRFQTNISPVARTAAARGQSGTAVTTNFAAAYVEDIRENGVSVYDNGLRVGKEAPGPIEILLKTNGGNIAGVVVDSKQDPKAGALVTLVPPDGRRQNPALYKTATSDAMGRFTIRGIAPGPYKLFAWENLQNGAYQNPAFLSKYEERGRVVNIMPATTTNTQITAIAVEQGR